MYKWIGQNYLHCCGEHIPPGGILPLSVPEDEIVSLKKRGLIEAVDQQDEAPPVDIKKLSKPQLVEFVGNLEEAKMEGTEIPVYREEKTGEAELTDLTKPKLISYVDILTADDAGGE